jgi:hypothetical protein
MAEDTTVNSQVTDAVTQGNLTVVGVAPAQAAGLLYQTVAHSISLALSNATHAQGCLAQIGNAGTAAAIAIINAAAIQRT